jgi:D-tyrosyl-tRNA(Tyr) deacylase
MRAIIQRVLKASVAVEGRVISEIGPGLLTLLGVGAADTEKETEWLMRKITSLRLFEDEAGKMNRSLLDVGGSHLIVSQFTLWGNTSKGNRPSFIDAAKPGLAQPLYEKALEISRNMGVSTWGGQFQASMQVSLINDGPVTFSLETPSS